MINIKYSDTSLEIDYYNEDLKTNLVYKLQKLDQNLYKATIQGNINNVSIDDGKLINTNLKLEKNFEYVYYSQDFVHRILDTVLKNNKNLSTSQLFCIFYSIILSLHDILLLQQLLNKCINQNLSIDEINNIYLNIVNQFDSFLDNYFEYLYTQNQDNDAALTYIAKNSPYLTRFFYETSLVPNLDSSSLDYNDISQSLVDTLQNDNLYPYYYVSQWIEYIKQILNSPDNFSVDNLNNILDGILNNKGLSEEEKQNAINDFVLNLLELYSTLRFVQEKYKDLLTESEQKNLDKILQNIKDFLSQESVLPYLENVLQNLSDITLNQLEEEYSLAQDEESFIESTISTQHLLQTALNDFGSNLDKDLINQITNAISTLTDFNNDHISEVNEKWFWNEDKPITDIGIGILNDELVEEISDLCDTVGVITSPGDIPVSSQLVEEIEDTIASSDEMDVIDNINNFSNHIDSNGVVYLSEDTGTENIIQEIMQVLNNEEEGSEEEKKEYIANEDNLKSLLDLAETVSGEISETITDNNKNSQVFVSDYILLFEKCYE